MKKPATVTKTRTLRATDAPPAVVAGTPPPAHWSFRWADLLDERSRDPALTKGERTLVRLKTGAAEALDALPYQAIRVADIVERAQVSYGLFYHYFTDKQEVAIAVLSEFIEHLERIYQEVHFIDDEYEAIFLPNLVYVNVNRRNAGLVRAALTLSEEVESFRTLLLRSIDHWHQRISRSLNKVAAAERESLPAPIVTAYALGGMIDQLCQHVYAQRNPHIADHITDVLEITEAVSVLWFRAIHGRTPSKDQLEHARQLYRDFALAGATQGGVVNGRTRAGSKPAARASRARKSRG